jgi:hypothetical protein
MCRPLNLNGDICQKYNPAVLIVGRATEEPTAEEPRETYSEVVKCEVSQMDLLGGRQYSIGMRMN